jgi:AP-2 complex subunit alpha
VWKLLYIYMLGYDVEFGHMEAVGLISSPKYAEKQVGYMVTSVLLNEARARNGPPCAAPSAGATLTAPLPHTRAVRAQHHEFLRLVINSIRNDITSRNDTFQALGLVLVSNGAPRMLSAHATAHAREDASCRPS